MKKELLISTLAAGMLTMTGCGSSDDSGTTDLFTLLGTADTGGTWSPTLTSGTGVFDPLLDAEGTYTYSLINACGIDSADSSPRVFSDIQKAASSFSIQ